MDEQRPRSRLERRRLIRLGAPLLGLVVAGELVARETGRPRAKPERLAERTAMQALTLAAAAPRDDPALLAAHAQDIFARHHLDVGMAAGVSSARAAIEAVRSGRADGAFAPVLSWLPALQDGLDARLVCGLRAGNSRLLIRRHAPMHRIEDLYRHAIGIAEADPDDPDRLFFSIMMRRKGMHPDRDVTWRVFPEAALGAALAQGHVQAIIGHDPVIWRIRESLGFDELASSQTGSYAIRVGRVLGVRGAMLRDSPRAVLALSQAMQEAVVWAARHQPEISRLLAAQDNGLTQPEVTRLLHAEGGPVHPVGHNLRIQIAQYVDELKLLGLTPESSVSSVLAKRFTANLRSL